MWAPPAVAVVVYRMHDTKCVCAMECPKDTHTHSVTIGFHDCEQTRWPMHKNQPHYIWLECPANIRCATRARTLMHLLTGRHVKFDRCVAERVRVRVLRVSALPSPQCCRTRPHCAIARRARARDNSHDECRTPAHMTSQHQRRRCNTSRSTNYHRRMGLHIGSAEA